MTRRKRRSTENGQGAPSRQTGLGTWRQVVVPIVATLLIGIAGGLLVARQRGAGKEMAQIQLAPISQLPDKIRRAPPIVQEAYRFAIANPHILSKLPCFCGCGGMGHKSDLDCFVERLNPDGSVLFGYHAFE